MMYSYLKPESVRAYPEATVRPWAICQVVGDALTFASALGYMYAGYAAHGELDVVADERYLVGDRRYTSGVTSSGEGTSSYRCSNKRTWVIRSVLLVLY